MRSNHYKSNDNICHKPIGSVMVAGKATVTSPDALGSNGVIHAIDTVIVPPSMEKKLAKIMSKAAKKQKRLIGSNKD